MLSSDVATLGHQHLGDGHGDGQMGRPSKRRISGANDYLTNMGLEFATSMSPLPFSSPSLSSPLAPSVTEIDSDEPAQLPKRISIMSVIRPIPKRISTQFYNEAHQKGLTLEVTNQAAIMAHDWHRKWTYQDEANHTMPDEDFYQSTKKGIPDSYGYNEVFDDNQSTDFGSDIDDADHCHATNDRIICLEREEGAKNPSLGSSPDDRRKMLPSQTVRPAPKRHFSAINDRQQQRANSGSTDSQLQDVHKVKSDSNSGGNVIGSSTEASTSVDSSTGFDHNVISADDNEDDEDGDIIRSCKTYEFQYEDDDNEEPSCEEITPTPVIQRPLAIRPIVIKPVAIHINRPDVPLPQPPNGRVSPSVHSGRNGKVPRDIVTTMFTGAESVSPMSYSQLTGASTISSRSSLGNDVIGITVLKPNENGFHLVEDDAVAEPTTKDDDTDSISTKANNVHEARDDMLHTLAISDGDVESDDFKTKVDPLEQYFRGKDVDTRSLSTLHDRGSSHTAASGASVATSIEGMWLTLSKPNWFGRLGHNDNGDPLYTLGRMSFDMFSPTNLVCSLQGNFNRVEIVSGQERKAMLDTVPKKLREEVESGKTVLRTYHIVTAFTIEPSMAEFPNAPNKDVIRPIKGIMTTYGYSLPDPDTPNRHSIWFTGGRIEPNNDSSDIRLWKNFFTLHPPMHSFGEKAKLLAVKLLMGATIPEEIDPEDGSMNYVFTRPLGGHGMVFVDVLYLDDSLRVVRGQRGTTFVFSRVPNI